MNYLTTQQAAKELKVTAGRIRAMIGDGRLKATNFNGVWMIAPRDLDKVRNRKPGRPKQKKGRQR